MMRTSGAGASRVSITRCAVGRSPDIFGARVDSFQLSLDGEVESFIDRERLSRDLAPWVPDAADRDFVVRCIVGEGPIHHRGANHVLLSLLGRALAAAHAEPRAEDDGLPVPMRLAPHHRRDDGDQRYPVSLSVRALERLAPRGSAEMAAMVDCLTDGPPQHALANVVMVGMLGALLDALERT